MVLTLVLLGTVVVLLGTVFGFHKWRYRCIKSIPGVEPLHPLFGNLLQFAQKGHAYMKCFRNGNRMTKIWFGPIPVINVQHPELVQKVLTECLDKPFVYDYLELGNGLISERHGHRWREHRKTLGPLFNSRILHSFIPIFESASGEMLTQMESMADGRDVDIRQYIGQCTAQFVQRTMMNIEKLPDEFVRKLVHNLERVMDSVGLRMRNAFYAFKSVYKMTQAYREELSSRRICYALVDDVLVDVKANALEQKDSQSSKALIERIYTIQHQGRAFTEDEIKYHIRTMLITGYETSVHQLSMICLMIAMHPEYQDKVFQEISATFPTPDTAMEPERLKSLEFLEQVIFETMRLYPVAPLIGRVTSSPITLDGVLIPGGINLVIHLGEIQRRPDVWGERAREFDPENFSKEKVAARHPYAFIPFSGGPRVCIGNRYSIIAMKVFLVRLLQSYELRTRLSRDDFKFEYNCTNKLLIPYTVQLERRQ
ncbi:cytochrome P450 4c21-like [Uranotaenia lowii]|uniref:cytochrome P450 4c21-like n=1 Tax=Uranotaenia lowii TaxID=190385 RepID=UPI00247B1509|nr:cytochrome P450 4c21-like [Uranotaenia lowii]